MHGNFSDKVRYGTCITYPTNARCVQGCTAEQVNLVASVGTSPLIHLEQFEPQRCA
jgi:hypothetical protein